MGKKYTVISNFKFLIKTQWKLDKKSMFFAIASTPMEALVSLISVYLLKLVVDSIENGYSIYNMIFIVLVMSLLLIVFNILKINIEKYNDRNKWRLNNFVLRKELDNKIMDMDYEKFISPKGKILHGKASSAISGENGKSVGDFLNLFIILFSSITGFFAYTAILFRLNWIIIALLVLSYVVDLIVGLYVEKWLNNTKTDRSVIRKKLIYIGHSTRNNSIAKDIRLYHMTPWIKKLGEIYAEEDVAWTNRVQMNYFKTFLFEALLSFLKTGLSYAYLIYLMLKPDSTMGIGDFCLYFTAISEFGVWLSKVVGNIENLINSNYEVTNYREFIDLPDEMNRKSVLEYWVSEKPASLVLNNVSYTYPGSTKKALENISLKINSGESIAIVGLNGSGKTTLIKIICGLLVPNEGQVYLNDIEMNKYDRDDYYSFFSAIFQDYCILPTSIKKNITLSTDKVNVEKLERAIELSGLKDKINSFCEGIDTKLLKNIIPNAVELSGGETQKLLLSKAIYRDASIIILDEPTAALDPIAEEELYIKYNDITKNKTSIFISHRLSSTKFCDRIVLLEDSKIIEQGTHDELMLINGKYAEMFKIQSSYYKENAEKKVVE